MPKPRKHPPYQLRVNKAVDRLLLANLINKMGPADKYTYHSLAGPFLEDLRVMHHYFPEMKLISFEDDTNTYNRQKFHKFCSKNHLELKPVSIGYFILHDYEPKDKDIFWLDYTGLEIGHFNDFQNVLKAVLPGSIIRITLRAQPNLDLDELEDQLPVENIDIIRKNLNYDFREKFDALLSVPAPELFSNLADYALTIQRMIGKAASEALDTSGSPVDFMPIESTRYRDGVQMLSLTGIVYIRKEKENCQKALLAKGYKEFDWKTTPRLISVPALSTKELLALEDSLPIENGEDAGEALNKILSYMEKKQLAHYAEFHREYPQFIRVSV